MLGCNFSLVDELFPPPERLRLSGVCRVAVGWGFARFAGGNFVARVACGLELLGAGAELLCGGCKLLGGGLELWAVVAELSGGGGKLSSGGVKLPAFGGE